jgi:HEAT repeat protein
MASLRLAFRDPDPAIRLSLLESLLATDEGRPLLQEALADADETVRAFAAFWLAKEEER